MNSSTSSVQNNISYVEGTECTIEHVNGTLQLFIIVLNTIHTFILKKLRKDNDSVHLHIVVIMSIHDISISSMTTLSSFCVYRWIERRQRCVYAFIECWWLITGLLRYTIVATASYDRYIAICKPFEYSANRLLANTTISLLTVYLTYLTVNAPFTALQVCGSFALKNPLVADRLRWGQLGIYSLLPSVSIPVIITTLCLVVRELRKMKRQRDAYGPIPDLLVIKTTRVVLVTVVVFICCLIPPICTEIYFSIPSDRPTTAIRESKLRLSMRMIFDSYAIINTFVFAIMHKPYQRVVIKLWKSCVCQKAMRKNLIRVEPLKAESASNQ